MLYMNIRRLLIVAGLIGLVIIVLGTLGDFTKIAEAFEQVHWYVFPLVIVVQIADYYTNARYYQAFFKMSGYDIPLRWLYETSLGINFANQAIPSGGIAGTTYLAQTQKRFGVPTGRSTMAQVSRYVFTFLSFFTVLALGFLLLFLGGSISRISVRLVVLLLIIVLTVGFIGLVLLIDRTRLEILAAPVIKAVNAFGRRALRRREPLIPKARIDNFLDDFYAGTKDTFTRPHVWPPLFGWALASNFTELTTLYVVFIGFGLWPNPGIVIAGYTLAIIASMMGILIGGLAVYEAGMIGTFVALGLPFAITFAIVTVYRLTSMAIFLPVGFYFYRRQLEVQS
jgi:uncharacterized protein (TIRG00374 family)